MDELLKMCVIVCPLVFLGAFVDSVAGGGGLITLPAYLMAGLPVHVAAGTNKLVAGIGTATATAGFLKNGKVRIRIALCAALGSTIGAFIGTGFAKRLPADALQALMLVALPLVAVFLVVKKDLGRDTEEEKQYPARYEVLVSLAIGLVIGLYDGIIGPGTGTFLIMAFTMFLSLNMITASGCAKVANLASNTASAISYIASGKVLWMLALPAALCSILGGYCGSMYAVRGGSKRIRGMIFVVLGMLFAKMLYELIV